MFADLSDRQEMILKYIVQEITIKGYPPAVREICEAVGLKSTSSVHSHLNKLEDKGYIRRDPTKPRAIEVLDKAVADDIIGLKQEMIPIPVIGTITAGSPILAAENIEQYINLPSNLIVGNDNFILRIKGDSMVEIGINDKDLAIIDKAVSANNGEIIAALIDGEEATIKTYYDEKDYIRLQPENSSMDPFIYEKNRVKVLGKLTGIFRTY